MAHVSHSDEGDPAAKARRKLFDKFMKDGDASLELKEEATIKRFVQAMEEYGSARELTWRLVDAHEQGFRRLHEIVRFALSQAAVSDALINLVLPMLSSVLGTNSGGNGEARNRGLSEVLSTVLPLSVVHCMVSLCLPMLHVLCAAWAACDGCCTRFNRCTAALTVQVCTLDRGRPATDVMAPGVQNALRAA